jgi:hypothetical protein
MAAIVILTILICGLFLVRWQVIHVHTTYERGPIFCTLYKYGDLVYYLGCPATVIDVNTTDIVIRRHLIGLIWRRHESKQKSPSLDRFYPWKQKAKIL